MASSSLPSTSSVVDPAVKALESHIANPKTRAAYITRLQKLAHELHAPSVTALMQRDAAKYVSALREYSTKVKLSPLTTKNMVAAVLACYKYTASTSTAVARKGQAAWMAYHQELKQMEMESYKRNEPLNERQEKNYVSIDEVEAKLKQLLTHKDPHKTLKDSQAVLLLAMYAWLPPKRSDYGELWVVVAPKSDKAHNNDGVAPAILSQKNYVLLTMTDDQVDGDGSDGPCQLVINQHKTANTHQAIIETLPKPFERLLRASLQKWPRQHVFVDRSKRPYTNNGFTKYVIRTFAKLFEGRAAGTSLLRHAYISERVDFNKMSVAEREDIAKRMGHTTAVQELVYKWVNHRPA